MLHERDALALDRPRDERLRRVACSSRKRAKTARSAAWSWPSTVATCQPNARSFASRSPSATISSVGLSDCTSLRSTTTQSRPSRSWAAAWSASQFCPSWSSPSPVITTTRPAAAEPPLRERDPAALGDAHAERARARLDPGHADVGVAVEAAEAPQPQQALARHDAEGEQHRVQAGHVVALRREEDVAIGIVEAALGDVELVEQEVRDEVERAEGRAEVPRPGALHGDEGVQPARVCEQREPGVAIDVGGAETVELGRGDEAQIRHVRHETVATRAVALFWSTLRRRPGTSRPAEGGGDRAARLMGGGDGLALDHQALDAPLH